MSTQKAKQTDHINKLAKANHIIKKEKKEAEKAELETLCFSNGPRNNFNVDFSNSGCVKSLDEIDTLDIDNNY